MLELRKDLSSEIALLQGSAYICPTVVLQARPSQNTVRKGRLNIMLFANFNVRVSRRKSTCQLRWKD